MSNIRSLLIGWLVLVVVAAAAGPVRAGGYEYFYGGRKVVLQPNPDLVVVKPAPGHKGLGEGTLKEIGAVPDPLNKNQALRSSGYRLYRRTDTGRHEKSLKSLLEKAADDESLIVQPVFEQGPALLIPTAEIVVGGKGRYSAEKLP